jgi:hypothetical protein
LRAANCAEEHGVGRGRGGDDGSGHGNAVCVDGGAAHQIALDREGRDPLAIEEGRDLPDLARHFGSDTVARQHQKLVGHTPAFMARERCERHDPFGPAGGV